MIPQISRPIYSVTYVTSSSGNAQKLLKLNRSKTEFNNVFITLSPLWGFLAQWISLSCTWFWKPSSSVSSLITSFPSFPPLFPSNPIILIFFLYLKSAHLSLNFPAITFTQVTFTNLLPSYFQIHVYSVQSGLLRAQIFSLPNLLQW